MKRINNHLNPFNLKNNGLNIELYGDDPDPAFVEMVRENGVIEPIVVTQENVIISGHRRNQAARICGLNEVPVTIVDVKDELEIQKLLILFNEQREKTTEQRAREFKKLKEIEQKLRSRGAKPCNSSVSGKVANLPPLEEGKKTRDIAAEQVGMSARSAEEAAKVVDRIDELEDAGETDEAAELRETLNKSVSGAARKIAPEKPKPKPFNEKTIDDLFGKLVRAVDARYEAKNGRAEQGECLKHLKAFDKALKAWRAK